MAPGVFADDNHPSGSPDPEKVPQIWQVDPITGALNVHIPITTTPSGGRGPKIPFSLLYNSNSTLTLQTSGVSVQGSNVPVVCADMSVNASACEINQSGDAGPPSGSYPTILQTLQWAGGSLNTPEGPIGPWTTSGPYLTTYSSSIVNQTYTVSTSGGEQIDINLGDGCSILGPFLYTDESGSTHDLNLIWDLEPTSNPSPPCSNAVNNGNEGAHANAALASDGSAFESSTNLNGSIGINKLGGSGPAVIYPDGTQYFDGILEDSNGNQAVMGSDSENRTAFSTTFPIAQIGQIPTGNYSVTTVSATGTTETYPITVGTAAFGTVNMPYPQGGNANDISNVGYCVGSVNCPTDHKVVQVAPGSKINVVTKVGIPDGNSYVFKYDPTYATISEIDFPTGGYVKFTWGIRQNNGGYGAYSDLSSLVVEEADIYPGDGTVNTWLYDFPSYSSGLSSTITAPDGSYMVNTGFGGFIDSELFGMGAAPGWKVGSTLYYNSSGVLLKSTNATYMCCISSVYDGLPMQTATTYYTKSGAIQEQTQYKYDAYANVTEKDDSGFYNCSGSPCAVPSTPSGGWARKTLTSYLWSNPASGQPSYDYTAAHIVNRPSQIEVTDGSGNPLSLVKFNYDENTLSGSAGIQNHDDTNYPASMKGPRGNLTSEWHCMTFSGSSCASWNKAIKHTYDLAGMLQSTTDPNGNETSYSYADAYSNYTPSKPTDAYLTTVTQPQTNGVTHVDTYTYFFKTGQVATHKDQNGQSTGQVTQYTYADPLKLNRITQVQAPQTKDGTPGQGGNGYETTTYTYTDTADAWSVQKTTSISLRGTALTTVSTYDGLGRLHTSQVTSDPDGATTVTRTYDSMSRLASITNPQRSGHSSTDGTTNFSYDALGEKVTQTSPDEWSKQWCYNGVASAGQTNCKSQIGSTLGIWVDAQDESGNDWQQTTDALGHMVTAGEPNGTTPGPSLETDYTYSVIGNLLSAKQNGVRGQDTARNRTFTYDGLSRLVTSSNPESGSITYGYDANGNLTSKVSPAVNSTTSGTTQTMYYCYDELNRLTYKYIYSGATSCPPNTPAFSTHASQFAYDGTLLSGSTFGGIIFRNAIGRLTDEQNIAGQTVTSERVTPQYDTVGRLTQEFQSPYSSYGDQYQFTYDYDLAGNTTHFNSGTALGASTSVQAITHAATYDQAGRLSLLQETTPWGTTNPLYPPVLINLSSTSPVAYEPDSQVHYELASQMSTSPTAPAGLTITDIHDSRERIVNENALGANEAGPAQNSYGVIGVTGTEQSGDTGTVTVTVTDTNASSETYGQTLATTAPVSWTTGSTPASLVTALTSKINAVASTWIVASADDTAGSLNLSSVNTGVANDYGIEVTATDTAGKTPSFHFDFSSTSGGEHSSGSSYPVYNYTVPPGGYAPNGNLLSYSDAVMGDWAFQYDTLNRLTTIIPSSNAASFATSMGCYAYDAFGNRTLDIAPAYYTNGGWDWSGGDSCSGHASSDYTTYNANNQTASYKVVTSMPPQADNVVTLPLTYDVAGNVINDGTNQYVYDAEGRLCAVGNPLAGTMTAYLYDASGQRLAKGTPTKATFPLSSAACKLASNGFTLTNEYLLDQDGNQVTELNSSQNASGAMAWAHSNVWAGGHLAATYDEVCLNYAATGTCNPTSWTPELHFHLSDPLGTRRVQTNPNGQIESFFESFPYGDGFLVNLDDLYVLDPSKALSTADDATKNHFTGKERDAESGNDYFGARYYASTMGRFLSPDWSAKQDPVPYARLDNPQTLNLYAYLRNNPLAGVDADGHCPPDGPCDIDVTIAKGSDGKPAIVQPSTGSITLDGQPQYGVVGGVRFQVSQDGKSLPGATVSESNKTTRTVDGKPAPGQPHETTKTTDSKGGLPDLIGDTRNTDGTASSTAAAKSFYDTHTVVSVTDQTLTVQGQGCSASFTDTRTVTSTPGQKPTITVTDPKPVPPPQPPPKPNTP